MGFLDAGSWRRLPSRSYERLAPWERRLRRRIDALGERTWARVERYEAAQFARLVWDAASHDGIGRMSAVLAFYALFTLIPFLVIIVPGVELFLGHTAAHAHLAEGLSGIVGENGAAVLTAMSDRSLAALGNPATLATGLVFLLYAGHRMFKHVRYALNSVWSVRLKKGRGLSGFFSDLFVPVAGLFLLALAMIVATVADAAATGLVERAATVSLTLGYLAAAIKEGAGIAVFVIVFAMLFKILPHVRIAWRDVWVGAIVTALLFTITRILVGAYLLGSGIASDWGTAGFVVIFLVWIYLVSLSVLMGAEITQVYANRHGAALVPEEDAELIAPQWGRRDAP